MAETYPCSVTPKTDYLRVSCYPDDYDDGIAVLLAAYQHSVAEDNDNISEMEVALSRERALALADQIYEAFLGPLSREVRKLSRPSGGRQDAGLWSGETKEEDEL